MDYYSIKETDCLNSIEKYKYKYGNYFSADYSPNKKNYLILQNISDVVLHTKDFFEENLYNKLLRFNPSHNDNLIINAFSEDYLSFKSREIIKNNPHLLIDAIVLTAKNFEFKNAEIYLKWCYKNEAEILEKAIEEAKLENLTSDINIKITALEKLPYSKINNIKYILDIEDIIEILLILRIGAYNFKKIGTNHQYGLSLASVSGAVNNPSLIEIPLGTPLYELLYFTDGMKNGDDIKCIFAGGFFSAPVEKENIKNINIDYDSFRENKLKLSSGVFFIVPEEVCMIRVVLKIIDFAVSVSCKKCMLCRTGFIYLKHIIENILQSTTNEREYKKLLNTASMIKDGAICPQIKSIAECVYFTTEMFKKEFLHAIENKRTIYSFL